MRLDKSSRPALLAAATEVERGYRDRQRIERIIIRSAMRVGRAGEGTGSLTGLTCIITVHGIGFQRAPTGDAPGYADRLHENLGERLASLGDDPNREGGPVYVVSEVDGSRAAGLERLATEHPLVRSDTDARVAHVALVYSPSEPLAPRGGSVADTLARALLAHSHYTSVLGETRSLIADTAAMLRERHPPTRDSSLVPRTDLPVVQQQSHLARLLSGGESGSPGPLGVFVALEHDMAAYVVRNDLRERVRGFVQDALLKIARRPDVDAIVVNAHSQGTVICWDVLCRLPLSTDTQLRACLKAFVTAGSPIRKYIDLFAWGEQVGEIAALRGGPFSWRNFWDPHDPVADPLNPPATWRPGTPPTEPGDHDGLLLARDPNGDPPAHVGVSDFEVDNIRHSTGGGLQAHDYWNNRTDFIPGLASAVDAGA